MKAALNIFESNESRLNLLWQNIQLYPVFGPSPCRLGPPARAAGTKAAGPEQQRPGVVPARHPSLNI